MNILFKKLSGTIFLVCMASILTLSTTFAAEEHPDLTGVWTSYFEPGEGGFGGFGGEAEPLPFTPEGKRLREEYQQLVGPTQDNPGAFCVNLGMPAVMESAGGYPIEFIQRPEQITMIYEVEGEIRRVYLGDNVLPKNQRYPSRQGYSTGYWDGDTLVVNTDTFSDGVDQLTHPHSEEAAITERFSLGNSDSGAKVMSYEMTMVDPVYYTEEIVVTKKWTPIPDGQIIDYNCPEEPWLKMLELRRVQLHAGEPVTATMADVYETEMYE